jgi:hypothetical protein|tara:strand:- start:564 stop:1007 length:444 start_codon:yes stop_codon:yes gene_type:complete
MFARLDKIRWLNILLAGFTLAFLGYYAHQKAPEILALPYRNTDNYIASNGSLILETSKASFTVGWAQGVSRTFKTTHSPPFKEGDTVAFKLWNQGGVFVIQEYHVFEKRSHWYARLMISVPPLVFVLIIFLKDFKFSWRRLIFFQES